MIKEITCYTFSFSNRVTSRFYNAKFLNAKPDANVIANKFMIGTDIQSTEEREFNFTGK